jgi:hypothetical protein
MPREKGCKKLGGRVKGTPNKKTQAVIDRLAELKCDPIERMVVVARDAHAAGELSTAAQMYKELAQYVAPKRKAIEVTGADGGAIKTDNKFIVEVIGAETSDTEEAATATETEEV